MENFLYNKEQEVQITIGKIVLEGLLFIPQEAAGLILFVHGSGSSRFSKRNQLVAKVLNEAGLATLLFDLFTIDEETIDNQTRQLRFDINFLATRLIKVTEWCLKQPIIQSLSLGYFGASTGGGAALSAAANKSHLIHAVVSRGGRPDLAGDLLGLVHAPTLLLVGGRDKLIIQLNSDALEKLNCIKKMNIIPGATHLFEEKGTLEEVAYLAKTWFVRYLVTERKGISNE